MCLDSDIWPELQGSDHCPVWTDLEIQKSLLGTQSSCLPGLSTKNIFTGMNKWNAKFIQIIEVTRKQLANLP